MIDTLVVLAKRPVPGRVKTRLVPPLSHVEAADLAAASLTDTLDAVDRMPARRRMLAFDGPADEWLRDGWLHCLQPDGGLDRRLAAAFSSAGPGPTVLVGMDTPQLRPEHLAGFAPEAFDACLGPAADGGYWAIGFSDPSLAAAAIHGVPMSTDRTAREQLRRLGAIGLRVQLLDELVDVDTIDSASLVADSAPATRFAAAFARTRLPDARQIAWAG